MKILLIGCFHGKFPSKLKRIANSCDYVLSTGDLGGEESLRKLIFKNMKNISNLRQNKVLMKKLLKKTYDSGIQTLNELEKIKVPVYLIDGNWDFDDTKHYKKKYGLNLPSYKDVIKKRNRIKFWGHSIRQFNKLNIYSHGGMMFASIYRDKISGMSEEQRLFYKKYHAKQVNELFKRKSKNLDLMIAHCPPYGVFDQVLGNKDNPMNKKHVGFQGYTKYIKKYHPKIFVCGHMHEHQGMKKLGKTTIISHGPAQDGRAAILELSDDYKKFRVEFVN